MATSLRPPQCPAGRFPASYQRSSTVAPVFEHQTLGPAAPQDDSEAPIPRARLAAMELVVNLFDGGPNSKVWFSIDGGPAVAMARSARVDALVAKLQLRIKDRSVYWTPPRDSTHIWAAPCPATSPLACAESRSAPSTNTARNTGAPN